MNICKTSGYFLLILIICIGIVAVWLLISYHPAEPAAVAKQLSKINQDPAFYIDPKQQVLNLSSDQQQELAESFKKFYFSPWDNDSDSNNSTARILELVQRDQQFFLQSPGWQLTYLPFTSQDIQNFINNADLSHYPTINKPGIIVHVTQVREFPTLLPSFSDPKQAGEGYPFDRWIESYLYPGAPIRILQMSKDQNWYLIKTASYYGWIPNVDVAYISDNLINIWRNSNFVVPLRDGVKGYMQKGTLYPIGNNQEQQIQVLVPYSDENGNALIRNLLVDKNEVEKFPIPVTPQNIARLAKNYIGQQYGWGNLYQMRDCSATTSDLLANFGFWLPRNSSQQGRIGKVVSLSGLSNRDKIKILTEQAIPFTTIIHFPGHIGLFLGVRNGQAYVFQDVWGLRTRNWIGKEGRAVLGETVILPLNFGAQFSNVVTKQISLADSFSILSPESYKDQGVVSKEVWQ